jgi:Xaa-Pro aminopeptidase
MDLPGLLVTDPADLFYMTGESLDGFFMFLAKGQAHVFTSEMLKEQVKAAVPFLNVVAGKDPFESFLSFLKRGKFNSIGIDHSKLKVSTFERFKKNNIKLLDSKGKIEEIRQVKDNKEIEKIRISCKIASQTYEAVKKLIKPGVSEIEISFKIDEIFARKHVKPSFQTIVAFGDHSAYPHHVCTARKLLKNDTVLIDMGCIFKGYCSDLTRTHFLGKITRLNKQVYSLVAEAKKKATQTLKPAVKAGEVDNAARRIIASAGFGKYFIHSTGHGVGVEIHESPRISRKNKALIKPGMVITIEPGIYLPGKFGVRIEDTYLVTETGNEVMTQ